MINQTLHTIKGLCNGICVLFFAAAIILQLSLIEYASVYDWRIVWLIGAGLWLAGWAIDEKIEG